MYDRYLRHLPDKIRTFRRDGNSEVASLKQIHYSPITSYIHSLVGVAMRFGMEGWCNKASGERTFEVSTVLNV